MNIFEAAARQKLRIPSSRGELAPEQLWDLPLTSKTGFDLDTIAKAVNKDLKAASEETFVSPVKNPAGDIHALRLELLKFVIADKLEENKKRLLAAEKAEKRAKILEVLGKKQDEALGAKSVEDLMAELAALDN